MNKDQTEIVFYFPINSDIVGGVQVLFARLAEYLYLHSKYKVAFCDYKTGFLHSSLKKYAIKFIEVTEGEPVRINEKNTVIIYPLNLVKDFFKNFSINKQTKVLLWEFGPLSFIGLYSLSNYYNKLKPEDASAISSLIEARRRRKILNFIKAATMKKALFFMCNSNAVFTSKFLKHEINNRIIPVALKVRKAPLPFKRKASEAQLHVAWMSRLEIRKTRALMLLARDLSNYVKKNPDSAITMHVIGKGGAEEAVKQELSQYGLEYRFPGRLEGEELKRYIRQNIDVAFGMGMSALEFAAQGVPAVFTVGEIFSTAEAERPDKYKWVFDAPGYDVTSEPAMYNPSSLVSIKDIFDRLKTEPEIPARQSRQYVLRNHSVPHASDKLLKAVSGCSFRAADLKHAGLHQKNFEDVVFKTYYDIKHKLKSLKARNS